MTSKKETLADTKAQLSSPKYDFEKEYAFGDFNRHSNADMDRQNGVDTFEDKEIVFKDISYDQLMNLMQQEGNFLIQLSGSWCHNSRAMGPSVNEFAKKYGIDKDISYDQLMNLMQQEGNFLIQLSGSWCHNSRAMGPSVNEFAKKYGIDTIYSYDQLMNLMQQEGNFLIQLSGSWCHNSRAMGPSVNEFAKKYGIDTIYSYDFNVDNGEDGSMFVRMTNGKDTVGAKYNYMYGEMVSRFLTNLDDWIEYPSDSDTAISYTNADGKEVTVGRLQQPIMFLYNKDNVKDNAISYTNADGKEVTVGRLQQPIMFLYNKDNVKDNSGKGVARGKFPVVYAFEQMVDRDEKGLYVKETDAEGNDVLDKEGKPVMMY